MCYEIITSAILYTVKTLFASAKLSAIADCRGEFQGLLFWIKSQPGVAYESVVYKKSI